MIHDRYLDDSFNDEFWSNYGIDYISMYKYCRGLNCMGFPDLIRSLKRLMLGSIGF